MTADELTDLSLAAFEKVVGATPGFRARAGQHAMAVCVAKTLASADLGEHSNPTQAIAVIQAGTGVGKSAAYASTAIALALERKTRVLISTATVSLQEQLMSKDLPALALAMDTPFVFALAKGRGRYVCKLKLERLVGTGGTADDMFDADTDPPHAAASAAPAGQDGAFERRFQLYEQLATSLADTSWDGDRDSLAQAPDPRDWASVAAERHTCTVRHCPRFRDCSYYQARIRLSEANVIVANHDLVLASLGMKTLPDLDNCLVIFDEAHHLPSVALDQFASQMDMSNLRWLDKLPKTMHDVGQVLQLHVGEDVATVVSQLKAALTQLARMGMDLVWAHTGHNAKGEGQDGTLRFAHGVLPQDLVEPVSQILAQATGLSKALDALAIEIKAVAKEDPSRATLCAQLYAKLGALAPRLTSVVSTASLLLEHGHSP